MIIDCRTQAGLIMASGYRLIAEGVDISDDTYYVETSTGVVGRYLKNEEGQHYIKPNGQLARFATRFKPQDLTLVPNPEN